MAGEPLHPMTVTKLVAFEYTLDDGTVIRIEAPATYHIEQEGMRDHEEKSWDQFYAFIDTLEAEYGVHDVGFDESTELMGYNSCEIEHSKVDEHWEKYIGWFKANPAFQVGPTATSSWTI